MDKKQISNAISHIDAKLIERANKSDIADLSVEVLLQMRSSLLHYLHLPSEKEKCTCEIVSVDDNPNKTSGWQCQCFRLTNPNRKLTSFLGPGFTNWVGGNSGGTSAAGNLTENVVDPRTGEVFVVEYRCHCASEAV